MQRNGYGWEGRTISYKKIICLVALLCFSTQAYGQSYTPVINLLFINSGGAFRVLGDSLYFVQADGDTAWILDVTDTPTSGQVLTIPGANKVASWETSRAGGVDFADSVTHDSRRVPGDSLMTDAESEARRGWTDDGTVVRLVAAGDSVGIGTSIPQSEIDVQSDTAATLTLATKQTAVLDGAQIGRIDFNAPLESSGSNSIIVGASIWGEADINFSPTNNNTEIVFATAETGAVAERMRLTADGNLGIGATSPSQLLEVAGAGVIAHFNSSQSTALWVDRGATTRSAEVVFLTAETPNWYIGTPDSDVSGDGSEFFFGTSAQGASPALWIETDGSVGIGTVNPTSNLHIFQDSPTANQKLFLVGTSDAATRFSIDEDGDVVIGGTALTGMTRISNGSGAGLTLRADSPSGELVFVTGGSANERMRIVPTGNVGIGTTAPTSLLTLKSSTTPQFAIVHTTGADSTTFGVDASGNLTIVPSGGTATVTGNIGVSGTVDGIDVAARASLSETLTNKTMDDFSNTVMSDGEHRLVYNNSGAGLVKGNLVYISGEYASGLPEVSKTDANASATMPCIGVVSETIANGDSGDVHISGTMSGLNTSTLAINDALYVSETAGASTSTKPTGTALIQKIAVVSRVHASLGSIEISGAYRTNDIPNIPSANFWLGNGSGVPTAVTLSGDGTMDNAGALTISTVDGITSTNLVDKSAAETISGAWDFDTVAPTFTVGYIRHLDVDMGGATKGSTAPTETTVGTFRGLGFDADAEVVFFALEVPSDWDGASDMTLVVHWYPTAGDAVANTETVKWDATYRSIAAGEAVDNGTAVTATATFTGGGSEIDKEHYETSITIDYDNANQPLSINDDIGFQFDRDVTGDTYSGAGIVYKIDLVYTSDSMPRGG